MSDVLPKAWNRRVSDDALLSAYRQTGSVHKAGAQLGIHGSSAHERLQRLGATTPIRVFTEDEKERLRREYLIYRDSGQVARLALEMGRTVPFLSRQAGRLGLTDARRAKPYAGKWKYMTEHAAGLLFDQFQRARRGSLESWCRRRGLDSEGFSQTMRRFFSAEWEALLELRQPKTSRYRRGRAFEYAVRDGLRKMGYFVMRAPASRSPIDLVGIRSGAVLFIQCKISGVLGVEEWNALYELSRSVGAIPLLAERPGVRGIRYWRLLDRKDGSRREQPRGAYLPEHG